MDILSDLSSLRILTELGNPRATGYGAGSQLLSVGTSRRKVMSIHRLW